MHIRHLVNPADRNPSARIVFEQPATESGTDPDRPVASSATPGVRPDLFRQTQQFQQTLSNQFSVPAIFAIPRQRVTPPASGHPVPVDLRMLKALPTSADRVQAVIARFDDLWARCQWAPLNHMLMSLARSYPQQMRGKLPQDLRQACDVIDRCEIILRVFLKGSAHCYGHQNVSTAWMRYLRNQNSHHSPISMVEVVTRGPLQRYEEEPQAVHATMAHLSWLLPEWEMRSTKEEHPVRIARAMLALFQRLDELRTEQSSDEAKGSLLDKVLQAVKPPFCSPQMRDTLNACFAALPQWLQRPLSGALMNIDKNEGAELYPPNSLSPASTQRLTDVLNDLRSTAAAQQHGRKVPRAEVRGNITQDEPAPKRIRLDDPSAMQPAPLRKGASTQTGTASTWFVVPAAFPVVASPQPQQSPFGISGTTEQVNATPEATAASVIVVDGPVRRRRPQRQTSSTDSKRGSAQESAARQPMEGQEATLETPANALLKAIRLQQVEQVRAALLRKGAWTARAQQEAESQARQANSTVTHAILEIVNEAVPVATQDS